MTSQKQKEYDAYIRSNEWKQKRQQALERDKYQCRFCESTERLEVHHRHYRNFGNEDLFDLVTVCKVCHDALTNIQHKRKNQKYDSLHYTVTQERISRHVQDNQGTVERSITITDAQWSVERSNKPILTRYQRSIIEAQQD